MSATSDARATRLGTLPKGDLAQVHETQIGVLEAGERDSLLVKLLSADGDLMPVRIEFSKGRPQSPPVCAGTPTGCSSPKTIEEIRRGLDLTNAD